MDLSKNEFSNTLFFNLTRPFPGVLDFVFSFYDTLNQGPRFKTKFDINKNLYCIDFNVSSNSVDGPIMFILSNFYSFQLSNFTFYVINSPSHSFQPEIISIKAFPSTAINTDGQNQFQLGWNVTILNEPLGFTFGTFEIISNLDSLPRIIKINEFNRIKGNAQNGTYTVYTTIATKCTSQNFTIRSISLSDSKIKYNPLSTIIGTPDETELMIRLICPNVLDTTPPVITDFSVTPSVKVFSLDRRVQFTLSISDESGTGISFRHLPYLLLASENGDTKEIPSLGFSYVNESFEIFDGYSDLPYGFGFNNITISIYGIVDNRLNYASYLTSDLRLLGKSYRIFRDISVKHPYLVSSTPILSLGGQIGLFGAGFGSNRSEIKVLVDFKDGKNFQLIDTDFLSNAYLNLSLSRFFQSSIDVQVFRNGLSSNILTVNVSDYSTPQQPTPTPNITTTPNTKTCPGNPICNNKGKCNLQTLVCECIPMWYGPSCASEIIIIPTPTPQPQPTSETTYVYDSNNITSVVQVIAVRELDDIYNVVNEYQISNWTLTIADPKLITIPTYYYQTQLGNTSTTLNVTIEFFSNQTERQFGGQNISISPSSIKFSMSIGRYQFQSKTNYLQVVMAATIQGSDGSCSSKSIGSGNDNNVRWIKMNIDKTSLYGRFITYGIIDGNVRTIENRLIDDDNETETSQTRTTKVGITIPNFDDSVLLDPDFSNLIDVNNDSNENEICQSKKKLSDGAIAGIVVGCVVAVAILVGVTLYLRKRAKYNREKLKMSQKLKKNE
ncbi:EGF-like domain-containing protein [Heterostelium album PN500]|uniref:EGF-like domain-containing protein n=1 Tax=Heterostelium pallidum (strain ATCC 26659 / Pp 5 / PN500) TaxID=670386 RepID=D3BG01_HETP5|nr:EGF-like domain-containing protein [Heterostelium album PN500]EFA79593.1 EGF-like domain-containing protein [Heterostelium album PN500]|eukprot:XP_020431714.1 EGF-like domain-containing protein [Heterostelium album PN500]